MFAQHGFFNGNLIEFTCYVLNCIENDVNVFAIYTDFSEAFDKVSHSCCWESWLGWDSTAAFLLG
jgi:hypothetical protein